MKQLKTIFKATFIYKARAIATIVFNLLFVVFNLLSLVLFVPFLQVIFPSEKVNIVKKPSFEYDGITSVIDFSKDYYNYFMTSMAQEDPKHALLFVCVTVVIAFFFKSLFRYLAIYHQSQLRMAVVRDYRDQLFKKSMGLPISFFTEEKKGDLMSRMNNDVNEIETAVIAVLELVFRDPLSVIITVSVLIYWSPALTLFSFILLPLSALIIAQIGKSLKRTASKTQKQMGVLFSFLDEYLGGIRIVKAFNATEESVRKFASINLHHQKLTTRAFRKRDISSPLNEFLGAVVMIAIVWFGGSMILDGAAADGFTGKEFIGFIIVFSQLLVPVQNIAKNSANLSKAKASQERIEEILSTKEKITNPKNPVAIKPLQSEIKFNNVSFAYQSESVLKHLNFEIPKGKTIALVGESGSGKSTIADLLPRFYDVNNGSITYDGVDITGFALEDLRSQVGIVNQESILFNDTVFNNIAFGMSDVSEEEVIRAAKIANAHDFIMSMDEGYQTNIGERGNKLSGGQKQRVSIARAVLKNPPIMILDEATSALDTESEKLVQDALDKLMKNRTSLVIAHRLSTIMNADTILVLSKGEIMERGTHDELFAKKGLYYKLSTMQGL
ncbi:antibiotic ABC transporter ATP-binding protein [Brumimicrobium salinarum]|uniref:Antibiotic ABC transporter ATP-binding protein n=1 Tax=Brumimicrobium salinarum TaxID=2058658 RepID=A0A2I0R635_9FLAO|nr:ABC transporter ATP-binding protein [Brumimicrobium salinarum]PKR82042.1 antibiotic ABC transporter ATP-binding protein [Brumimicrobium salinarum]